MRQAIAHLIFREAIVERVLRGVGQVGISMIAPDVPWFNPEAPRYDYDPERARELLAKAGYEDGLSLRHTNENPVRVQIAEILRFEAAQVGIDLAVTVEEFGAFIDRIVDKSADFDLFILGWGGNVDPNYATYELFSSTGGNNYVAYANPEVDELLERGQRVPPGSEESISIYQEAQRLIMEDVPFAFINYSEEIGVHKALCKRLGGPPLQLGNLPKPPPYRKEPLSQIGLASA